ncbi:MAG: prevent-host-death protein [Elusimicrobiota bacterium]|jgi:hypothetical protein|nr:prevent-host-death protein [Elusimicrobiota bacterium]
MKTYDYAQIRQSFTTVLNTALKEDVIIAREDGSRFKIISINNKKTQGKSPLENIKGIKANVTTQQLIEVIREGREGNQ